MKIYFIVADVAGWVQMISHLPQGIIAFLFSLLKFLISLLDSFIH